MRIKHDSHLNQLMHVSQLNKSPGPTLSSLPPSEQEPAGPQVHPMSMSLTTEPSSDGPTVTEGLIHHLYHINVSASHVVLSQH